MLQHLSVQKAAQSSSSLFSSNNGNKIIKENLKIMMQKYYKIPGKHCESCT